MLVVSYMLYLVVGLVTGGAVWLLARNRVSWHLWEAEVLFIPFFAWLIGFVARLLLTGAKGQGNLSLEPAVLGLLVPAYCLVRVALSRAMSPKRLAVILLAAASIFACLVALAVPQIGTPC